MTIFTAEYATIKKNLAEALAAAGWTLATQRDMECFYTLARKDYETVVGIKTATLALQPAFGKFRVVGDYQSEGRNVLSTTWLSVSEEMSRDEIEAGVALYAGKVDAEVDSSYARRLHIN